MKTKTLVLLLLVTLKLSQVFSQSRQQIDSLLNLLNTEPADSIKLSLTNRIGVYYMGTNASKAIEYFDRAISLAEKLNRPLMAAKNQNNIADCYAQKGNFDKALDHYFQSVRLLEKLKDSTRIARAFMAIANVYFQNSDLKKTEEYQNKAQRLIEDRNDSTQLIDLFNAKAQVYDKRGLYKNSLQYNQKAYRLAVALHDSNWAAGLLSDIGLTYKHQKKTAEALQKFDQSLLFFKKKGTDQYMLAVLNNNIGATQAQAGQYELAKNAFNKSLSISIQAGLPSVVMENYRNLSDMYGTLQKFDLQVSYLKKYYTIKDSLFTADSRNQLTQLEADYDIEQKNIEIIKQEREVERQKSQRNIFIFIAITSALLLLALALFYNRIKKANQSLEEKNNQINEQKNSVQKAMLDLKNAQDDLVRQEKLASIGQLTKGIVDRILNPLNYVENFSQLSTGVLDDLSANLNKNKEVLPSATIVDLLDDMTVLKSNFVKIQTHSRSTTRILKDMQKLLKEKSRDFLETDLNSFLANKSRTFLQEIRENHKEFEIKLDLTFSDKLIQIFILPYEFSQVIQNLVSNSYYTLHEKSKSDPTFEPTIKIGTESANDQVIVRFRDNGKGIPKEEYKQLFSPFFTTKPTSEGTGLGLYMIKEIINLHKGTIDIQSSEGEFTEIVLTFPVVSDPEPRQ
ncbi:tetratricopeptide repeat protein [Spirosoma agri]